MPSSSVTGVKRSALRRALATFREGVATELWPVPLAAVIAGVVLGIVLPLVDSAVDASLPAPVTAILFVGGVDSARAVLSAIAGSLITATSLTFSLTVVALQLASSQASPRILRTFSKDQMVHSTLAVFVGTFAYSLTVLRTVQDSTDTTDSVVPRIAVTLASLLTFVSVVMLTFFLAHLARQLRVETAMRQVHAETSSTIALVADTSQAGVGSLLNSERPARQHLSTATSSGFIRGVDRADLLITAVRHDIVVEEEYPVGRSVIRGTPLARWWPNDVVRHPQSDETDEIGREIAKAFDLAYERTASQDIGFGIRQLVDIAARAVSPGVNDPTTAVHALGHLSAILGDLGALPEQPVALADDDGTIRVILRSHDFASLVEVALEQTRRYGASDPAVAERLFQLIREVAYRATEPSRREVMRDQLDRLVASVASCDYDTTERDRFATLAHQCDAALNGEWL